MENKFIKVVAQVIVIYSPVVYWNLNFDTVTVNEAFGSIIAGSVMALLIEGIYRLKSFFKSK